MTRIGILDVLDDVFPDEPGRTLEDYFRPISEERDRTL
jgi:hypothetical protein